jgi:hypothetical protein
MQSTNLFVAGLAVRVGVGRGCWVREDPANPGLKSETLRQAQGRLWGTRIWGGGEAYGRVEAVEMGCATSTVAVRV